MSKADDRALETRKPNLKYQRRFRLINPLGAGVFPHGGQAVQSERVKPRHAAALALVACLVPSLLFAGTKPKLSTYSDQAYGLSFQYLSDVTASTGVTDLDFGYLGPVQNGLRNGRMIAWIRPVADVPVFLTASIDTTSSEADCVRYAPVHHDYAEPRLDDQPVVRLGKNVFIHAVDGNAGLCHQASMHFYRIFKNHACYEFEIGVTTHCEMTKDEIKADAAVMEELSLILKTVTISPAKIPPLKPESSDLEMDSPH